MVMESVIVLNKNYQYWTEAPIKKVLKWLTLNKIEVIAEDKTAEIGSYEFRIKMPLIVRLLNFIGYKPKRETIPYSDEAVYQRDDNICQYWHYDDMGRKFKKKLDHEDRSIDHVVPTSRGGPRCTFENSVTSCKWHNVKIKKNKTPEEAGLELIRKPFIPKRNRNDYIVVRFTYNKSKLSHNVFYEKFLGLG